MHSTRDDDTEPRMADAAAQSPCIQLCEMNAATGFCRGCYRTLDEIVRWSSVSDAERRAILAQLERRARA